MGTSCKKNMASSALAGWTAFFNRDKAKLTAAFNAGFDYSSTPADVHRQARQVREFRLSERRLDPTESPQNPEGYSKRENLDRYGADEFKLSQGERDGVNAAFCKAWDASPHVSWQGHGVEQEEVEEYLTEAAPDFVRQWVEDGKLSLGYGQLATELEPLETDWQLFWRTVIKGWTAGVKDYDLDLCIQESDNKTTFLDIAADIADERFADIASLALSTETQMAFVQSQLASIEAQMAADLDRVQADFDFINENLPAEAQRIAAARRAGATIEQY